MGELVEWTIQCPYCGEDNSLLIDAALGRQEYVEDCQVCCQPIVVRIWSDNGAVVTVEAWRENE